MSDQVFELLNCEIGDNQVSIKLFGWEIPVKFRNVPNSKELLIIFHSSFDRKKRSVPAFEGFLRDLKNVSQLSVSDPSMLIERNHSAAWYAGHEGFDSQKILPGLFLEIVEQGNFERVVFLGGSSGGFASLFYSSFIPDSVAIAAVPQTNLNVYRPAAVTLYRENCWGRLTSNEHLSEKICVDLCNWYSILRRNTIIYVQSAGDTFHTRTQLTPFLEAIQNVKGSKFILDSGFWGKLGHSGSVPPKAYLPWVRAAFASTTIETEDILMTYYNFASNEASEINFLLAENVTNSSRDLILNNLIRDYQLLRS